MRRLSIILPCLFLVFVTGIQAQDAVRPKDMTEVGLHAGTMLISGDLTLNPGYGVGVHVRKSLDYVFSLRGDLLYGQIKQSKTVPGAQWNSTTNWVGGSFWGVMSLNSLRWDRPTRKTNYWFMLGIGASRFSVDYTDGTLNPRGELVQKMVNPGLAPHLGVGVGLSVRVTPQINVGVEAQALTLFGNRADQIDGFTVQSDGVTRSLSNDIPGFAGISINYNLGNPDNNSEPLYWINPLDNVMKDIQEVKNRPEVSLEDSDGDGVIDALDQEQNTPQNAIVDVKGRTLDSDRDGVPDHLDKEPFYTPRANEQVNSEGVAIDPATGAPSSRGGGGVSESRVREIIQEALKNYAPVNDNRSNTAEWFLPMIHFASGSTTIKYSDYGNLASVARTMQSNQNIRLVVTGYTDATGGETLNNNLSYQRANAVIEHMETIHGLPRSRFVLQWKGSEESLVPVTASYMNRRVEFRVAGPGDFDMDPPSGSSDGGY